MGMVKEFKEFALRGNVVDLAVGVIIGAAFGKIVAALIEDIIMPTVGIAGNVDFSNQYFGLTPTVRAAIDQATVAAGHAPALVDARKLGPVLAYGDFITIVINFLILAFCIFMMVKLMNKAKRTTPPPPAAPAPPSREEVLLTEIRDALRARA
jgi:large conductance mechanosensitive channel